MTMDDSTNVKIIAEVTEPPFNTTACSVEFKVKANDKIYFACVVGSEEANTARTRFKIGDKIELAGRLGTRHGPSSFEEFIIVDTTSHID